MGDHDKFRVSALEAAIWARQGRQEGTEVRFLAPCHEDHHPSARWHPEKWTWFCDPCGRGGGWRDLASRLGLNFASSSARQILATYDYKDEADALRYQVVRLSDPAKGKTFRIRRPDGAGGWIWGQGGEPDLLYELPQLVSLAAAAKLGGPMPTV